MSQALTGSDSVRVEVDGDLWTLTLTRPDRANALTDETIQAMRAAIDEASAAKARALVIEATGRAFCAGFDLSDVTTASDGDLALRFLRVGELLEALYAAPFVTIACAAGPAIGAGADLVAACDHRILEPGAVLGFPGAGFGIVLGTRRLGDLIGPSAALDLVASGRRVSADEAVRSGLATRLTQPGGAGREAAEVVERMRRLDVQTFRAIVRVLREDTSGGGLADLARSLARGRDLADRIHDFRQAQRSAPSPSGEK